MSLVSTKKERDGCPRDPENSPSSRTDENMKADYAMFSTEGKGNLSKAKKIP